MISNEFPTPTPTLQFFNRKPVLYKTEFGLYDLVSAIWLIRIVFENKKRISICRVGSKKFVNVADQKNSGECGEKNGVAEFRPPRSSV